MHNDIYIINQIREAQKELEDDNRIQLEVPVYYDYNYDDEEKVEEEPKRVIIIDL